MSSKARILDYLNNCWKDKSLSHAYLILGNNIQNNLNITNQFLDSANIGASQRRYLEPENDLISIDSVRSLRSWLNLSATGSGKAGIIKQANFMNPQSQNAFLKILEEPIPDTYIFMLSGHKKQLLPTITSRVVCLNIFEKMPTQTTGNNLFKEIGQTNDPAERMRIWLRADIKKEEIQTELRNSLFAIRNIVLQNKKITAAKSLKNLLESLSQPKGQNWQLIAENLILNL